jgi:thymidine phosphorylase
MDVWRAMVTAQGGDPDAPLPTATETELVRAARAGIVATVDALAIGTAAWRLGAGRARKEDPVSAAAGVVLHRKPGEPVRSGDPVLELRADHPARLAAGLAAARDAVVIADTARPAAPLVIDRRG